MSPLPGGSITLIPCDMRVAVAMWPLNELLYISITLLILLYSIVRTVHMNNSGDRANVFGPLQLFQLADIFLLGAVEILQCLSRPSNWT